MSLFFEHTPFHCEECMSSKDPWDPWKADRMCNECWLPWPCPDAHPAVVAALQLRADAAEETE